MKLILPVIIIMLCVGAYFMYISPVASEVKALSQKKADYDNVLLKSQELKKQKEDIDIKVNNISATDIDRLNKIIPEKFNSILFAYEINVMAGKDNLVIKDFKINPQRTEERSEMIAGQKENAYKTIIVTFNLIGQYNQFLKFLSDLELNLRLTDIVKLSIKPTSAQKSGDDPLSYSIEMNTYSLK